METELIFMGPKIVSPLIFMGIQLRLRSQPFRKTLRGISCSMKVHFCTDERPNRPRQYVVIMTLNPNPFLVDQVQSDTSPLIFCTRHRLIYYSKSPEDPRLQRIFLPFCQTFYLIKLWIWSSSQSPDNDNTVRPRLRRLSLLAFFSSPRTGHKIPNSILSPRAPWSRRRPKCNLEKEEEQKGGDFCADPSLSLFPPAKLHFRSGVIGPDGRMALPALSLSRFCHTLIKPRIFASSISRALSLFICPKGGSINWFIKRLQK